MQVKVCPKCGVPNLPSYRVCKRCQTSLEAVEPVDSSQIPQQNQQNQQTQQAPQPTVGVGTTQAYQEAPRNLDGSPAVQPMRRPLQTNATTIASPPTAGRFAPPVADELPAQTGTSPLMIVGMIVLVIGILVGGYFVQKQATAPTPRPAESPDKVVTAFLKAKATGDINQVKPCISRESVETLDTAFSGPQAESAGFDRQEVHKMFLWDIEPTTEHLKGATFNAAEVEDKEAEKDTARVRATVHMTGEFGPTEGEFDYIVVIEDKQWKVDLKKTAKASSPGIALPIGR